MSIYSGGNLHDVLEHIMEGISKGAKNEPLKGHPLATLIRNDFKEVLCSVVQGEDQSLKVETSAGQGKWATVVWGAILDPSITSKTSCGYFVVYHFHPSGKKVFLSICQGAQCLVDELKKKKALAALKDRGSLGRRRLKDLLPQKHVDRIRFDSSRELPLYYQAAFITGVEYNYDQLPSEVELRHDLKMMCSLYRVLDHRGGVCDGGLLIV